MKTVHTEKHRLRDAETELYLGKLVKPFERPSRADYVIERVRTVGLGEVLEPREHDLSAALAVHDADFVAFLQSAWDEWAARGRALGADFGEAIPTTWPSRAMPRRVIPRDIDGKLGYYALAAETSFTAGSWAAAKASMDVALTARGLIAGGARSAFALCRPPGHHAATDMYGGYCFLNNAAIAAQAFLTDGAARVAILDVDFHHGNGTQEIFYERGDVLFLSLHGDPVDAFPHFLGYADETGSGAGEGMNGNYPLPPGTAWDAWGAALEDACGRIAAYAPDALVVSLGVDTYEKDPISFFKLGSDDFTRMGARIAQLGLPSLFVLEGGYAIAEIGVNAVNVLTGFEGG